MIIIILGGVGSGKSVTSTKFMVSNKSHSYCNYNVKSKNVTRLKKEFIINKEVKQVLRSGREVYEYKINWDFWNKAKAKHKKFNIVLDEVHNLIHSRQSTTKWNTLMSMWISQIRKILGDSEKTHVVLLSQKLGRIDIAFRDLAHKIILCQKYETTKFIKTKVLSNGRIQTIKLPVIYIIQYHFIGQNCIQKLELFNLGNKTYDYRTMYFANPFFRYYDSYELFGETDYL